ncbi:MAG TPA: hypothetical protein VEH31_24495, partial [Streptosporangiaceae bacterium]|nr:hypothetical protein [Streptosporangiaceae bacterium]
MLGLGAASADSAAAQLARLMWFCWHGNVFRALQTVEDLVEFDLDVDGAGPDQRKPGKAVDGFGGYLGPTPRASPTTGSVAGETIASSVAESAVHHVVSAQMVK